MIEKLSTYWADDPTREARLLELVKSNRYSRRDMANILSAEFGIVITRNTVGGKLDRMSGAKGATPPFQKKSVQGKHPAKVGLLNKKSVEPSPKTKDLEPSGPEEIQIDPHVLSDGTFVTVLTITPTMCHWPIGEPGDPDFHFCGRKVKRHGCPYCDSHARKMYQPSVKRGSVQSVGVQSNAR